MSLNWPILAQVSAEQGKKLALDIRLPRMYQLNFLVNDIIRFAIKHCVADIVLRLNRYDMECLFIDLDDLCQLVLFLAHHHSHNIVHIE
jgi:hypothetical protein